MPQMTSLEGAVTATFKSGLKVDRVWHAYTQTSTRIDVRLGDKVRCQLDEQGQIARIEITERGSGTVPADTMSEAQKGFLERVLDDREHTLQTLEGDFLGKYLGKRANELSRYQAQCLLDLLTGRTEPYRPKGRGHRRF